MGASRGLAYVAGAVLVLGGGAMAAFVGPDDTLEIGTHTVPQSATGLAVATHPEITQFVGVDMLVRVSAPTGVWVGTSHRVDTVSLLDGVRHYEISRMALNSVGGRLVEGEEAGTRRALRPQRLPGWRDQAYAGPDEAAGEDPAAEIVVPLDGTPTDVVAVPDRRDERVTLTIGVRRDNLFRALLGVVGVGVALVGLGVFLSWWARRPPRGKRVAGAAPGTGTRGTGAVRGGWRVRRAAVPVMLSLVVLSGCSLPGPAAAPTASEPASRVALTLPEAQVFLGRAVAVHAEEFTQYPMWAVVELSGPPRLRLMERESFRTRWRGVATVRVRDAPVPVSPPRPAGPPVQRQAEDAVEQVSELWTVGEAPGLGLDRRTRRVLAETRDGAPYVWPTLEGSHVIEVKGGWLVLARHVVATPSTYDLTTAVLLGDGRPRVLGSRLSAR